MYNINFGTHDPVYRYPDLNEEQDAQRHGHLVRLPSLRDRLALRLGHFFLRMGERLTREDPCMELSKETV